MSQLGFHRAPGVPLSSFLVPFSLPHDSRAVLRVTDDECRNFGPFILMRAWKVGKPDVARVFDDSNNYPKASFGPGTAGAVTCQAVGVRERDPFPPRSTCTAGRRE